MAAVMMMIIKKKKQNINNSCFFFYYLLQKGLFQNLFHKTSSASGLIFCLLFTITFNYYARG